MNKYIKILIIGGLMILTPLRGYAANITVPQSTAFGQVLIGNQSGGNYTPVATSTLGITGSGTVTTITAGTGITLSSGATCTTTCTINSTGGGASFDWFKQTNYNVLTLTPTTTIPVWIKDQLFASSSAIFAGLVTANNFVATGTVASTFPYASTTAMSAGTICLTSDTCRTTWPAGTVTAVSVSTANGFAGSSSGGATPALTLTTTITGVLKGNGTAISAASNGTDYTLLTAITCTNQFLRAFTAAGVGTCATVGAADVSLANLTATDSTLTFSGTYNGSTARTIGLNLGNSNVWTASTTFQQQTNMQNASTTIFSANTVCLTLDTCRTTWPTSAGGGTGNVGTSTVPARGNLAMWTTSGATPELLGAVATGTISTSGGITTTAGSYVVGSGLTIGCTTAASGVAGCLSNTSFDIFNGKANIDWNKQTNYNVLTLTPTTTIPVWFKDQVFASSSAIFAGQVTLSNVVATSTVATSTFAAPISIATTSQTAFVIKDQFGSTAVSVNTASTTGNILELQATSTADKTIYFAVDQYGHWMASSTKPTVSSGSVDGTDLGGVVTGCSSACTVTFANPWPRPPGCSVTPYTGSVVNTLSYTVSATAIVVTETGLGTFKYGPCGIGI